MTRTEEFEGLRPLLFAIAYRILGSVTEAEDALQETWLRWESSATQARSSKAYLSAVVTRISIDGLRSARMRRLVPSAAKTASKEVVNLVSRSRMRNLTEFAWSARSIERFRACWATQPVTGLAVTPAIRTRRVSWWMNTRA